jgi:hypothetical protein
MSDGITHPSLRNVRSADASALPTNSTLSWWQFSPGSPDADDLLASLSMPETPNPLLDPNVSEGAKRGTFATGGNGFDFNDYPVLLWGDTPSALDEAGPDRLDQFKFPEAAWESLYSATSSSLPSSNPPSLLRSNASTSLASPQPGSTADAPESQGFCSTGTSGCCLIRALELLKKLFPGFSACTCQDSPAAEGRGGADDQIPTIQRVITQNKHTLEAIQGMLQCPCSETSGSYLLAVISLVIFKVLAWYKAAVPDLPPPTTHVTQNDVPGELFGQSRDTRKRSNVSSPSSRHPTRSPSRRDRRGSCHEEYVLHAPAVIDGYRLDGDDQPRMAAQLVLSELHRVQRLINVLASRLNADGGGASAAGSGCDVTPFSPPTWFRHLEKDLRQRVRALSLEIVEMLRG